MTREQKLEALLILWFREGEGIADEMSYEEIDRQAERWQQLLAVGIETRRGM